MVYMALEKVTRHKTQGADEIQPNLTYLDEKALNSEMNRHVNSIWNEEKWSQQWKKFVSLLTGRVIYLMVQIEEGARGSLVVKAPRYKPAGRGFDSRWCHWNFSVT